MNKLLVPKILAMVKAKRCYNFSFFFNSLWCIVFYFSQKFVYRSCVLEVSRFDIVTFIWVALYMQSEQWIHSVCIREHPSNCKATSMHAHTLEPPPVASYYGDWQTVILLMAWAVYLLSSDGALMQKYHMFPANLQGSSNNILSWLRAQ